MANDKEKEARHGQEPGHPLAFEFPHKFAPSTTALAGDAALKRMAVRPKAAGEIGCTLTHAANTVMDVPGAAGAILPNHNADVTTHNPFSVGGGVTHTPAHQLVTRLPPGYWLRFVRNEDADHGVFEDPYGTHYRIAYADWAPATPPSGIVFHGR